MKIATDSTAQKNRADLLFGQKRYDAGRKSPLTGSASSALARNILKIRSFERLLPNWNQNGAAPLSREVTERAVDLLQFLKIQPQIFPTARQSVQFEYEKANGDYLEFEVFADKTQCYSEIEGKEQQFLLSNQLKANHLVKLFHAR